MYEIQRLKSQISEEGGTVKDFEFSENKIPKVSQETRNE